MSGDRDTTTSSLLRAANADAPLREMAQAPAFTVLQRLSATPRGLTEAEAADRLRTYDDNEPFRAPGQSVVARLAAATAQWVKHRYIRRHKQWL